MTVRVDVRQYVNEPGDHEAVTRCILAALREAGYEADDKFAHWGSAKGYMQGAQITVKEPDEH